MIANDKCCPRDQAPEPNFTLESFLNGDFEKRGQRLLFSYFEGAPSSRPYGLSDDFETPRFKHWLALLSFGHDRSGAPSPGTALTRLTKARAEGWRAGTTGHSKIHVYRPKRS